MMSLFDCCEQILVQKPINSVFSKLLANIDLFYAVDDYKSPATDICKFRPIPPPFVHSLITCNKQSLTLTDLHFLLLVCRCLLLVLPFPFVPHSTNAHCSQLPCQPEYVAISNQLYFYTFHSFYSSS